MRERPPWEGEVPLDRLAAASFPVLVVSGGHSPVFEVVCDRLAETLGAQRATIEGKGHSVPETGHPYNRLLEQFLASCEHGDAS
jgi:pimeloyl-ACP methyl ester carboxylesterase